MKTKTIYYDSPEDDVVTNAHQDFRLPANYRWIPESGSARLFGAFLYAAAVFLTRLYAALFWHLKIINRKVLKEAGDTGFFIYANHTRPVGDVGLPALAAFPRRIFTVVSQANYGLPVIGRILPFLGALPVGMNFTEMKNFRSALSQRIREKHPVVIYPEAHVWPYCTMIRPYGPTSFHFPVEENVPAYCMTTTYQKKRFGKKPRITVYIDGPFFPDPALNRKDRIGDLCGRVRETMLKRSENSTFSYISYIKRGSE